MRQPTVGDQPERELVDSWFARTYSPCKTLPHLLSDLLTIGEESIGVKLALCLWSGAGHSERRRVLAYSEHDPMQPSACLRCPLFTEKVDSGLPAPACRPAFFTPIPYRGRIIGFVLIQDLSDTDQSLMAIIRELADQTARLLQRAEVRRLAHERFGRELWLVGTSQNLAQLDVFLERAAPLAMPVLIRGERGTARADLARALHLLGPRPNASYVTLNCYGLSGPNFLSMLSDRMTAAKGGTFYVADVDRLELSDQADLAEILFGHPWPSNESTLRGVQSVRWVASCLPSDAGCHLHPSLADGLGLLEFEMEPLRARQEDLRHHIMFLLTELGNSTLERLTPEIVGVFLAQAWPGNLPQLRRVVARLPLLVEKGELPLNRLTEEVDSLMTTLPDRKDALAGRSPDRSKPEVMLPMMIHACVTASPLPREIGRWLHPALLRTVSFLASHSDKYITLEDLARKGHVSVSHLSHLFRIQLDTTPIKLLNTIRIEQAKILLTTQPNLTVTEVAGQVGYGDLRHFERNFKQGVGITPRAFRRSKMDTRHSA